MYVKRIFSLAQLRESRTLVTSSISQIVLCRLCKICFKQFRNQPKRRFQIMMQERTELIFFVNGKKIIEKSVNPEWTLLYYLRNKLELCGTKLGCSEGGCGTCTVMVSKFNRQSQKINHLAVNACLAPVCAMHGLAVTTVEGIGSTKTKLHPVQERIAKAHGSQCGFCTPGIVMSMYTLLRNLPKPSMHDLENALQGNLCRCTGYRPIIEAYKTFTEDWELMQNGNTIVTNGNGTCAMGDKCCKLQNGCNGFDKDQQEDLVKIHEFAPYDTTQEPIFPLELKLYDTLDRQDLNFKGEKVTWYRPTQLLTLLELKHKYPDAKIIVGNTEIGVEVKFKHCVYKILIQPTLIPELTAVERLKHGIRIGASVTLLDLEKALKEEIKFQPEHRARIFVALVDMMQWFAGKQIRSVASVGGNIMTGSPISDLNPIFIACKVELELESKENGKRTVVMDDNFFTGYRRNIVNKNEVLVALNIPYTKETQYFYAYKQARRRDDDIAIVNSAINVIFEPKSNIISSINFAFGGMAPTTVSAPKTSKFLMGQPWNHETLEHSYKYLVEDLPLSPSAPGGMIQYRKSLTLGFFFKAFLSISEQLQTVYPNVTVDKRDLSAIGGFHSHSPQSSQYVQVLSSQEKINTIGQPIPHLSTFKQATGEAVYCDDMPSYSNELYMTLVLSSKSHAKIVSIDASDALNTKGVHAFFTAEDVPADKNKFGPICGDEEVFASKIVTCQGQIIGAVVAENQMLAQSAAQKIKVVYEELQPVIVTIEDAIKHKSYFLETPKKIEKGDVDKVFATAAHVVEGECRNGAQQHFSLETQCTIAVPKKEDNEMEIFCATQSPAVVTAGVAYLLDVPQNRIITRVKRIGGGFGGKDHKPLAVALPAAFAASRLQRPIRCMLDRDEDMLITGARHPFYIKYKVAFDDAGKILGCEIFLYSNAGCTNDLSVPVLECAMLHFQNAYKIPHVRLIGQACKTNLPSNTGFRGFGGPQAMLASEFMIREIAEYLNKDLLEVCRINFLKEGDITYYNMKMENCTLLRCWEECLQSSKFEQRKREIEKYNKDNRWRKRGISITSVKHGIGINPAFANQGSALVHVYTDGSVLLTHGGTEMGQGLHTKMVQVASQVLEIPHSKIYISETATNTVSNSSPTGGSLSSDVYGMAVMYACETIKNRIQPYKVNTPKGRWEDWISEAYLDRVSLSATGFYKTPDLNYNWETNSGRVYNYFSFGAACSEVEIDCLTGDHEVLRTDIVMDVGQSLNPAIDVGQIEGAFMQGYGLFVLEEMVYSPNGDVYTKGPGTYKIPGFSNISKEFNVSLLKGTSNPRAIYSSKGIGEPPLFLASSILFAIQEAIKSARSDSSLSTRKLKLHAPLTSEKIRMACQDHLTAKVAESNPGTFIPWNVIP